MIAPAVTQELLLTTSLPSTSLFSILTHHHSTNEVCILLLCGIFSTPRQHVNLSLFLLSLSLVSLILTNTINECFSFSYTLDTRIFIEGKRYDREREKEKASAVTRLVLTINTLLIHWSTPDEKDTTVNTHAI
jgi:hypothetical protein